MKAEDLILFQNQDYIILNKPAGINSDHDNAEGAKSLSDIIKKLHPEAMMAHRLDKQTSGCIIAARHEEAYRYINKLFSARQVHKVYHALADGVHRFEQRVVDLPILKKNSGVAIIDRREGKQAITEFNTLENFSTHTLVEALPSTGRFHQIRVHLAALKAPIAGDAMYGGKAFYLSSIKKRYNTGRNEEELPIMARVALHARAVSFPSPDNGEIISIEAPYPKDFAVMLKLLRQHAQLAGAR